MAHPLIWPKKSFFYPIGNTPAVCFTHHLAPEERADVLLLGCGDPRSILYTAYADLGAQDRPLDFTCCDAEPAVLARNALLYTLVVDGDAPSRNDMIWNIFYHFYVDKKTLDLMQRQCQKLIDMSANLHTWKHSQYASLIRFCTENTLVEVARHWSLYLETSKLPLGDEAKLKALFTQETKFVLKENIGTSFPTRSAEPLGERLASLGPEHFRRFWRTGVTFTDPTKIASSTLVNPTFAHSVTGMGFNTHYGSDPLLSFHLAEAVAQTTDNISRAKSATITDLVTCAKAQFRAWCDAFRKKASNANAGIVIRLFAGEALAFCRALHNCRDIGSTTTGIHTYPWGGSQIDFDNTDYASSGDRAPMLFNTIDTSNLTDHLGLLNILIVTHPLLSWAASSVIHTDTLLPPIDDIDGTGGTSGLPSRISADLTVFALLFGLVPTSYVSSFTTESGVHDSMKAPSLLAQIREQAAWKIAAFADSTLPSGTNSNLPISFDPEQLAELLFRVYLGMFSNENMTRAMNRPGLAAMWIMDTIHYTRATLAVLIRIIKDRVTTSWPLVIDIFIYLVEGDSALITGPNNYQDLCLHLSLHGVYTVDTLLPNFHALGSGEFFRTWRHVPPVICVLLEVPRKKLRVLEDIDADTIKTPVLHCELQGPRFQNVFSSILPFFGSIKRGPLSSQTAETIEDPLGWKGNSPLLVSFLAPSWILTVDPNNTRVNLAVRGTPTSSSLLIPKLGPFLHVFSTPLTDKKHVHILHERPSSPGEIEKLLSVSFKPKPVSTAQTLALIPRSIKVTLDKTDRHVSLVTSRANISEKGARDALTSGAPVFAEQTSPCAMVVSFAGFKEIIAFPFPINGMNYKMRIARKSFYIEVDVALSGPSAPRGLSLHPFPATMHGPQPNLWNVHYLSLDRLPCLSLVSPGNLGWLKQHLRLSFSDRERASKDEPGHNVLSGIVDNISRIILGFAGLEGQKSSVFGLEDPGREGIHTLIFANALRLDLASHTVVVDACVLSVTETVLPVILGLLQRLTSEGRLTNVVTPPEVARAWKQLLPVLAERCRKWKHTAHCDYITKGIPISLDYDQDPMCGCGQGKGLDSLWTAEWKELTPLVTRIALGPLFSVNFLEVVGTDERAPAIATKSDTDPSQSKCAACGGDGRPKLLMCGGCRETSYCSVTCQKADWKAHKSRCKK